MHAYTVTSDTPAVGVWHYKKTSPLKKPARSHSFDLAILEKKKHGGKSSGNVPAENKSLKDELSHECLPLVITF